MLVKGAPLMELRVVGDRSYESAYNLLVDMFAPMSNITPGYPGFTARSKRWAEARMLADCLNLKVGS